jgi:hypothetical protein
MGGCTKFVPMKDDAKKLLNEILGSYDDKLTATERREAAIRAANESFPGRFAALASDVIRPALLEFVDLLNARGHEASVRQQDESSSSAGGIAFAAVILRVVPKPYAHKSPEGAKSFIEIAFSANRAERLVTVASTNTIANSSGSRGKRGGYDVEGVTADVVATHVLQTLQEALGETR